MKTKYFILFVMMIYNQNVLSHIVTTSHMDLPLLYCMKSLNNMMVTMMCPTYGEYSAEVFNSGGSLGREAARQVIWERVIKTCCTRPCSIPELISIC